MTEMLILESSANKLRIMVPADRLEETGLRNVVSGDALADVKTALMTEFTEEPSNWSRRFKGYEQKMASGSIVQVAEVVRDLTRRTWDRGVSPGEKRMLEKARGNLVSELALVPSIGGVDEAGDYLETAIRGPQKK
jgi:CarD family transcriptional regulator